MAFCLAFLQARMGSTRLPGKVLMRLNGKSILERAIERLRAARTPDGIVVLTTDLPDDNLIADEALRLGTEVFRGPDQDVLRRFQLAAEAFSPELIVRATADNPLIDIGSVDRILDQVRSRDLEYCMERNLPVGAATEAVTRAALARVDRLAHLPHHREHVTLYIKEHGGDFRAAFPEAPEAVRRPDVRITVDTPADFAFMESLIRSLPDAGPPVALQEYLPGAASMQVGNQAPVSKIRHLN
jgi:spore coat polysaccharide biosynthesis protein SpsF